MKKQKNSTCNPESEGKKEKTQRNGREQNTFFKKSAKFRNKTLIT